MNPRRKCLHLNGRVNFTDETLEALIRKAEAESGLAEVIHNLVKDENVISEPVVLVIICGLQMRGSMLTKNIIDKSQGLQTRVVDNFETRQCPGRKNSRMVCLYRKLARKDSI